jgi:hypothetical protein
VTEGLLAELGTLPGIGAAVRIPAGIRIDTDDFGAPLMRCLQALTAHGQRVASVQTGQVRLEDVFIALTGRALRDDPPAIAP